MGAAERIDEATDEVVAGGANTDPDEPEAPIRERLAAYIVDPDVVPVVRDGCNRIGLEFGRHAKTDIPNPAAHRGDVLLMDVPVGEARRFDWCKRVKEYAPDTRVVLLIHEPSRSRVYQGFLAGADVIVGWPIEQEQLAGKLAMLFPRSEP